MNPSDLYRPPLGRQESLSGTSAFEPYHGTGSLPLFARADSSDALKGFSLKEIILLPDGLLSYERADKEEDLFAANAFIEPIAENEPIALADVPNSSVLMYLPKEEDVEDFDVEGEFCCPVSQESARLSVVSPDPATSQNSGHNASTSRFRKVQTNQWSTMFDLLCDYKKTHGDCMVPYKYAENQALARWVKRQRYQYKCMKKGMRGSTMTPARRKALESIGFVWDSQATVWNDHLEELKQFHSLHGHCDVPGRYAPNPSLAIWVKAQRRQYRVNALTQHRMDELDRLGFKWVGQRSNVRRRMSSIRSKASALA